MSTPRPAPRAGAAAAPIDPAEWAKLDFTDRVRLGTNAYVLQGLNYPLAAYLFHAVKLTLRPTEMTELDVTGLRDAGWSDEDVMDIAEVTGLFNMSNRMASGLGWAPNPEYESLGR